MSGDEYVEIKCGKKLTDPMANNFIKGELGVVPIEHKICECRVRWFRHVQQRPLKVEMN